MQQASHSIARTALMKQVEDIAQNPIKSIFVDTGEESESGFDHTSMQMMLVALLLRYTDHKRTGYTTSAAMVNEIATATAQISYPTKMCYTATVALRR